MIFSSTLSAWRRMAWGVGLLRVFVPFSQGAAPAASEPPAQEWNVSDVVTGPCQLNGPAGSAHTGAADAISLSWLDRHPLPLPGLYWGAGWEVDHDTFANDPGGPAQLQDYNAIVNLQYFEGSENVAELAAQPGWYFENHFTSAAWDVPVTLVSGVPISHPLNGVLGFSNARFYHHAVPIVGLVWTPNTVVTAEIVYPEPAVVLTLNPANTLRLGGELTGGGFLSDPRPNRTAIEYESYLAGVEWTRKGRSGFELKVSAGFEVQREFDYFAEQRRLHGSGAAFLKVAALYLR